MSDTPSNCKKLLTVHLTQDGALRFIFEPGVEEMIEANRLHDLVGDTIAEFGENFRHKNRMQMVKSGQEKSRIIIPKGAIF